MTGKAIDIWVNLFTSEGMEQMANSINQETAEVFEEENLYTEAIRETTDFVADMSDLGVTCSLIPSLKFGGDNGVSIRTETVRELCEQYPDHLKGLFGIDPYMGMNGVRNLTDAVESHGFVGAHILPYGFKLPPNDRRYYPFYAKCTELDVPVVVQTGHTAVRLPNEPGRPKYLEDVAIEFPELDIVAANTGWPWTSELIALAWVYSNIYIGTTGHEPQYWSQELVRFIQGRGREKVMWGTNYPIVRMNRSLNQVAELNLPPESESHLFKENAATVFDL